MPAMFRIVQDDCPPIPDGVSPVGCISNQPDFQVTFRTDREGFPLSLLPKRLKPTGFSQETTQTSMDGLSSKAVEVRETSRGEDSLL